MYNKRKALIANTSAIKTAIALSTAIPKRKPTPAEQETLSGYSGFGGIKEVLSIDTPSPIPDNMKEPIADLRHTLLNLVAEGNQTQYKTILRRIKNSVLTAFYTPQSIITTLARQLQDIPHLRMHTFLEPSAGIGGFLPLALPETKTFAFEKDHITGEILNLLHPDTNIHVCGFENINNLLPADTTFDCIATNIPFGNVKVFDPTFRKRGGIYTQSLSAIHNYFILKSIDLLNENGLLIFIAPHGLADTASNHPIRNHIVTHTDIITALRLPDNLFLNTSGIEVGSDLYILRKHTSKTTLTLREQTYITTNNKQQNPLFTDMQNTLATHTDIRKDQYGRNTPRHLWKQSEEAMTHKLADILRTDLATLSSRDTTSLPTATPHTTLRRHFFFFFNTTPSRIADFNTLLADYLALATTEADTHTEQPTLRQQLNHTYDTFVRRHGYLHDNKDLLPLSPQGKELLTIENNTPRGISKADIFLRPVAFTSSPSSPLSPAEALARSLNLHGKVILSHISRDANLTADETITALQDQIYYNPVTAAWEEKERFIAGNVIAKSKDVRTAIADLADGTPEKTHALTAAAALEAAIPQPIPYEELDFNLGERWIPVNIYEDFARELFQTTNIQINYYDVNDTYTVTLRSYSPIAYTVYATDNLHGDQLLVHALHDTIPQITREITVNGHRERIPDEEAMQAAAVKIQEIRTRFNQWLDSRPAETRDTLVRLYNERFNCYVRPSYDGSAQTFPSLTFDNFPYKNLYPSQRDAIQMIKQNGGGVCWHEVGAGKTMIMCVAAYEMKRLQLVNKPLIIGLKANVHQIADTFRKAYPTARILYPGNTDFTPANREKLFTQIKNNNWDCIILTHEQFSRIPQSNQTMADIFTEELNDITRSLDALSNSGTAWANRRIQRGLEQRQQNLEAKLAELKRKISEKKDDTLDFHTMGIDHIFVDECHQFKNLMFQTRHTRVAGIGNSTGSQRAMNLLIAIRDIQARTQRDLGATFLSGTVVVNALTELYVLFKYLRPRELARQHVSCFDAWAAVFTQKTADYELTVTGSIRRKERFRTYIKVPELASFLREITDYRTASAINLDIPQRNVNFLTTAPTPEQEQMTTRLIQFANSGNWADLRLPTPPPANIDKSKMLIATDIARKMSLDMRLLIPSLPDNPDSKASRCAAEIYRRYRDTSANLGTQFVFSDLATYKPDTWNIYQDIKDKLVLLGIPPAEIQFIQTATTERARRKLFDDMNSGRVRVLFGSTTMLGTGVNAQQRAVAVHHLDIPWVPAAMEQRNGRAVRKGNTVKQWGGNTVDIIIYGTEKTLDAYKFNLLKNKQLFITQINNGTLGTRRIDEDSLDENNGMNFAEFVALLSGNTDLLNKTKLDNQILLLEKEHTIFKKERYTAERKLNEALRKKEQCTDNIRRMTADLHFFNNSTAPHTLILSSAAGPLTPEDTGRALHTLQRNHRSADFTPVATYMQQPILIRSTYLLTGEFSHNSLFLQAPSGLRYILPPSGILPSSLSRSANFPDDIIKSIPGRIKAQQDTLLSLEADIPALRQLLTRTWSKQPELDRLKMQVRELQKKIDEAIKQAS